MSEKVERLVNLTVALLETRRPLTLAEIRRKVAGYGHDDPESARRMFERDKEDLRRLGVPVETVALDAWETEWGYRVDRHDYELPPVEIAAEEVAALALAVHLTGQDQVRIGLTKLAAGAPDPPEVPAPAARVDVGLRGTDGVAEALVDRRALSFRYRTATGEVSDRTIDPYGLVQRRGAWYLVGRDHRRDAVRAFRLDRLVGDPLAVGGPDAFIPPADLDLAEAASGPRTETVDAVLAVRPELATEVAHREGRVTGARDDGRVTVSFTGVDRERLIAHVLRFGADVEVLTPPALRTEVADRLRSVVEVSV
jgi:proteasome accessory factor B